MRVGFLIPLGFLIGAIACRVALQYAPASIAVDLAQPLAVVTYWQSYGAIMWVTLFVAVAIASVGYVFVMVGAVRHLTMTMALSALACLCALAFPVIFSSDVYAYAGYGDMALHGINPYAHAPITLRDPLLDAMQWQWGNPPPMCVYGPAFIMLAKGIVALFLPLGSAAPLWAFRALECATLVACAPLAYAAFTPLPPSRRTLAAAGIALNPIAIWSCAEGHNDALLVALVLAGFAIASHRRTLAGAIVVALASLVKAPALAVAGAWSVYAWNRPERLRVLAGTAIGLLIVLTLALPLEYGFAANFAPGAHYFPQFSAQYALATILPVPVATASIFALCAAIAIFGLRRLYLRELNGAVYLAFAAWLVVPNPYPWYALWLLPVALLASSRREQWAIITASLLTVFRYYGDATTDLSSGLSLTIVVLQYGLPILLLTGARMDRARPDRREIRTPVPDFAPRRFP